MTRDNAIRVEGHVGAGFEAVRDAFVENFSRRHELGGACCVYHGGEKVVDLWGGVRNRATGEPWVRGHHGATSRIGTSVTGDPRELALRNALYSSIPGQVAA